MITRNKIISKFSYDPISGELRRLTKRFGLLLPGDIVGTVKKFKNRKYLLVKIKNRQYRVHVLVWLIVYSEWPSTDIDHIDHDGTNNKLDNLRLVTRKVNLQNSNRSIKNKSGVTGVCFYKSTNQWLAFIGVNGKNKRLGLFDDIEDAITARHNAELMYEYHPNHGLNASEISSLRTF